MPSWCLIRRARICLIQPNESAATGRDNVYCNAWEQIHFKLNSQVLALLPICPVHLVTGEIILRIFYLFIYFCTAVFGFFSFSLCLFIFYRRYPGHPIQLVYVELLGEEFICLSEVTVTNSAQCHHTNHIYIKAGHCVWFSMSSSANLENETTDCEEHKPSWLNALFSCLILCSDLQKHRQFYWKPQGGSVATYNNSLI